MEEWPDTRRCKGLVTTVRERVWPPAAGKGREMDSPLSLQKGKRPGRHLDFKPGEARVRLHPAELSEDRSVLTASDGEALGQHEM